MRGVRFVIPARSNSVRVPNKNHKEFMDGKSLTDIACEDVEHMCKELGSGSNGVLISDVEGRRFYTNIYRFAYPKFLGGSKTAEEFEVDNSLQLWHLGLSVMNGPQDVAVLIEPSSYPRNTDAILTQIQGFDKKTVVAVRIDHRYGMKAHVFVPTGEFYIAETKRVLDFTAFHGDMDYALSKATNINTQSDWDNALAVNADDYLNGGSAFAGSYSNTSSSSYGEVWDTGVANYGSQSGTWTDTWENCGSGQD